MRLVYGLHAVGKGKAARNIFMELWTWCHHHHQGMPEIGSALEDWTQDGIKEA
jgi:hypothetical protein